MKNLLTRSDLQIAVLDLEASALGFNSYPIEVGLALIRAPTLPILAWSSLVRPTRAWLDTGLWSPSSAAVHGIPLEDLQREGRTPDEVCDRLNGLLGKGTIVVTDAPRYDQDWLDTLFSAGDREQQFRLYDFEVLTGGLNPDQYRHFVYLLDRVRVPHRAGPDALRLASVLLEAHLGYSPRVEILVNGSDLRTA